MQAFTQSTPPSAAISHNPYVYGTPTPSSSSSSSAPISHNPYVYGTPSPSSSDPGGSITNQMNKCGKVMEETVGSVWQHFKTSPNIVDVTLGKLSRGTRTLIAGGYENIYKQNFETSTSEILLDTFPCFLSTSSNPIAGQLFVSTHRVAFLSDQPIAHSEHPNPVSSYPIPVSSYPRPVSSYYKVMVPWSKVLRINSFKNPKNNLEKYLQVTTIDHYEFWFMAFLNHDKVLRVLQEAKAHSTHLYRDLP